MADERNERTAYNWSYSGDDATQYRSKYTQGFDPDYAKRAAERAEQLEEEAARRRREQVRKQQRQRPSARRARLSAQQEILTEHPDEENDGEAKRSTSRNSGKTVQSRRAQSETADTGKVSSGRRAQTTTGKAAQRRRTRSAAGSAGKRAGTSGASRETRARGNRRQTLRLRYILLAAAAAVGIFLLLFVVNTYTLTISMAGDDPLYLELGETFQDPGATAVYRGSVLHFRDTEVPVVVEQNINNRVCGTYEVKYRASMEGQEAAVTRMVIIPDREAPVITLDETVNVVRKGDEWQDSFTATDDQDGDITSEVEVLGEVNMRRDGKYELTYRVQDKAGNEATATRTVIVSSVAINRPETAQQGDKNVIYLTFDGGPGMYTERLLDILDNHNVKATFFVTDSNPGSRDLIGEEYRRGHTVGVQSLSTDYAAIYENGKAFWEDIDQEREIVREQTGEDARFIRFPGGSSNDMITLDTELEKTIAAGLRERGLTYVDWTIDSYDSNDEYNSEDVYWNIVDQASVAGIKMVLCHDLNLATVEAIDDFLSWAIENHYVFLPVTGETPEVHHVEIE